MSRSVEDAGGTVPVADALSGDAFIAPAGVPSSPAAMVFDDSGPPANGSVPAADAIAPARPAGAPAATDALLRVDELQVHGPVAGALVRPVSFAIAPGQALSLLGESGSGKSLIAHALMGTLPGPLRATGRLRIDGEASDAADPAARRRLWGRRLALLPQEPWLALDPTMRVIDQIAESHALVGHPGEDLDASERRAQEDLDALGLRAAARQFPFAISGGMAQRVAFLATRAGGARVLIADEPTKGLDADLRDQVVRLMQAVLARGGAVLIITHDVQVARQLGGRAAVMLDGRMVEEGPAEAVLSAPRHAYTRRLLAAEPAAWAPLPAPAAGGLVLRGRGLSKRFGGRTLFAGVDLDIHAGERVAIAGASGSGKTTLGNLLLGLLRPDAGTVARGPGVGRLGLQKLYQDPAAAFAPRIALRASIEDLVRRHRIDPRAPARLMERLRLDAGLLDRLPGQVSGGELQRFALVRVLLLRPALLFADEPTSRLDPITQQETMALLAEAAAEHGCALLLVTHEQALADRMATRRIAL
jgi:peptide/nickel transport system ATP-binding protein